MTGRLTWATPGFRVHNGTAVGVTKSQRVNALAAGARGRLLRHAHRAERRRRGLRRHARWATSSIAVPAGTRLRHRREQQLSRVGRCTGLHRRPSPASTSRSAPPTPRRPARSTASRPRREPTVAHLSWDAVADADGLHRVPVAGPTPIDGAINYTSQPLPVGTTDDHQLLRHRPHRGSGPTTSPSVPSTRPPTPARCPVIRSSSPSPHRRRSSRWGKAATLSGALADGAEPFAEGSVVTVQSSVNGGATWADVGEYDLEALSGLRRDADAEDAVPRSSSPATPCTAAGRARVSPSPPRSRSASRRLRRPSSGAPSSPPTARSRRSRRPAPRSCASSAIRRQGGDWRFVKSVSAINTTTTRYSARFSLPSRGPWKLVASYKATAKYAATTSGAEYLRVK